MVDKTAYDKVMDKHQEKKQAAKERKEERVESGIVNKLVIDRTPYGSIPSSLFNAWSSPG